MLGESKGRLVPHRNSTRSLPTPSSRASPIAMAALRCTVIISLWNRAYPDTGVAVGVGHELRAVFDTVVLAEYHCHYDLRYGKVTDIRDGRFAPTRFASPQGALLPFNPQECCGGVSPPVLEPSTDVALSSPTIVALYTREDGVESSVEECRPRSLLAGRGDLR